MKKITPDEFEQMLLSDDALAARLMAMVPDDSEAAKTLAAEHGYDLELPEDITVMPEEALEQVAGGKVT